MSEEGMSLGEDEEMEFRIKRECVASTEERKTSPKVFAWCSSLARDDSRQAINGHSACRNHFAWLFFPLDGNE
jgi:hypothetical protein